MAGIVKQTSQQINKPNGGDAKANQACGGRASEIDESESNSLTHRKRGKNGDAQNKWKQ